MRLALFTLLGIIIGHLVHRLTPYLLQMKETTRPFKQPWVELISAGIFLLLAWELPASQWKWFIFATLLISVGAADAASKYIPSLVCYAGAACGLVFSVLFPQDVIDLMSQAGVVTGLGFPIYERYLAGAVLSLTGALAGFALIHFIRMVFRPIARIEVMGSGDALLLAMIGAWLGPKAVLFSLFPACLCGIVIGVIRLWIYKVSHSAFGPALAMGALCLLLYGKVMVAGFAAFQAFLSHLSPVALMSASLVLVIILFLLLLRLRGKGAQYERDIEADYREIDKKIKP